MVGTHLQSQDLGGLGPQGYPLLHSKSQMKASLGCRRPFSKSKTKKVKDSMNKASIETSFHVVW